MAASSVRWSGCIVSALVQFHPALEGWLHAYGGVYALQVAVLDVLLDPAANFDERLLLGDRKSTRLNSSHLVISYAVFCLKKKKIKYRYTFTIVKHDRVLYAQIKRMYA